VTVTALPRARPDRGGSSQKIIIINQSSIRIRRGDRRVQATGESPSPAIEKDERNLIAGEHPGTVESTPAPRSAAAGIGRTRGLAPRHAVRRSKLLPPTEAVGPDRANGASGRETGPSWGLPRLPQEATLFTRWSITNPSFRPDDLIPTRLIFRKICWPRPADITHNHPEARIQSKPGPLSACAMWNAG
jgi:hypothetical protein